MRTLLFLTITALTSCAIPFGDDDADDDAPPQVNPPACGDGVVDPGEVCDDGNTVSGDGCGELCDSTEICGNGILDVMLGEVCDDGNNVGGDGCSADCHSTGGCGNGVVDAGEQCDDGNVVDGDGCRNDCTLPGGGGLCGDGVVDPPEQCDGGASATATCDADCTIALCGDGLLNVLAGEQCDDGNNVNGDGCQHDCTLPP